MTTSPITVHIIAQAHLDPVWLWPWQAGLDEALATCRTACDLLDAYPDFIFTRGEAWSYAQVEAVDPVLFARIRRHIEAGRWEIVGGWWIQPDCNFPSGFGFERQIETGKRYLLDRFGRFPEVAYNVDSFGHAATLPGYMRTAGQRYYVMMRPQEHEMALPARLFRWRGYAEGPEVATFRIAGSYGTGPTLWEDHIRRALTELPGGIAHTMCFVGVGDHGGGATAEIIEWVLAHAQTFAGCRLEFSSPNRFFAAIEPDIPRLLEVVGELQFHAIGCYSVQRGIKTRVRRAEHLLRQAEIADGIPAERLHEAWEKVSFNHFHDILGGTSIPSAYTQCYDQLGFAAATADQAIQHAVRRKMCELPDDPLQRIVLYNASDAPFAGYTEFEPWTQWGGWQPGWRLLDAAGTPVPFQLLAPESATGGAITRLLFRVKAAPGEMVAVKIDKSGPPPAMPAGVSVGANYILAAKGETTELVCEPMASMLWLPGQSISSPSLDLLEDRTDNWTHRLDRYPEGPVVSPTWNAPVAIDHGPLLGSLLQTGAIGDSTLRSEWRIYAGEPFIEWRLTVHWREALKLLKCTLPLPGAVNDRIDGIPGAGLQRLNNGREYPLRDWTLFDLGDGQRLGIVCPDAYALDALPHRVRFTLLRSAIMTHHEPGLGMTPNAVLSDQGVHHFRFRFFAGPEVTEELLERHSLMLHRPLIAADLTRGMPRRY